MTSDPWVELGYAIRQARLGKGWSLEELAAEFVDGDFRFDPLNPDSARGQFAVLSRVYDDHDADMLMEGDE